MADGEKAATEYTIGWEPQPGPSQNSVLVARVEVQKYTPDRFPHRRLDRQIEKMIQRLFTKATR